MGVSMWMLDSVMHTSLHRQFNWSGFGKEIIATDSAQLLFRTLFVIVSSAFGISMWRSNLYLVDYLNDLAADRPPFLER